MKDLGQIDPKRDMLFKDSVLSAAEMHGMEIIARAQRDSVKVLHEAQAACRQAEGTGEQDSPARDARRQESALMQAARQELLRHRAQLVDALFAQVEEALARFASGGDYAAWLQEKLQKRAGCFEKGAKLAVWLRPADMGLEKELAKALPGVQVQADAGIRVGGARMGDGRVLYEDTLDSALQAEREAFAKRGGLGL